jgi:D-alanyl-D-alanine carboxypeptidase
VSAAGRRPLEFPPGSRASYSNTNYLVLAEIVRRVTKRPLAVELRTRIFEQLGLGSTTYQPGRRVLRDTDLHGYDVSSTPPADVSHATLGGPWADGAIVSNAADLATFFGALLRGKVVPPRLLARMQEIVPESHGEGMGLYRLGSPCGRFFYGHTGGTPGYVTFAGGTQDGRRLYVVAWTGVSTAAIAAMDAYLDALLCA